MDIEKQILEIKGETCIVCFPLEDFNDIEELECFVMQCKSANIGVSLKYETSNFHCGVFVECYDKNTCKEKQEIIN